MKSWLALVVSTVAMLLLVSWDFGQARADTSLTSTSLPTTGAPTLLRFELNNLNGTELGEPSNVSVASRMVTATDVITASADTEIIQGYPAANYAGSSRMRAGYDTEPVSNGEIVRSLIGFDLAGIPSGTTVYSATLRLFLCSSYEDAGHDSIPIIPHRISSPWVADTVTWDSSPSYGESYSATWITHGAWGWHSFAVTGLVRDWIAGTTPNYGLMLRGPETPLGWRGFATSETGFPPQLVVEYAQAPSFTLTLVPDSLAVSSGHSASSTLYLTATNGFTNSVALEVGGLPANTTCEWGANPVTPTTSTTLTITSAPDTPTGVHTFTVTGTAGSLVQAVQATLHVSSPGFELSLVPPLQSVSAGKSACYTAYLTATHGFSGSVTLGVGGLPANITHEWGANPVIPTTSTVLTITTTLGTPAGQHAFTVAGTGGGMIHSAQAILDVSMSPTTPVTHTVYLPAVWGYYGVVHRLASPLRIR